MITRKNVVIALIAIATVLLGIYGPSRVSEWHAFTEACSKDKVKDKTMLWPTVNCTCLYARMVMRHGSEDVVFFTALMANDEYRLKKIFSQRDQMFAMQSFVQMQATMHFIKTDKTCG